MRKVLLICLILVGLGAGTTYLKRESIESYLQNWVESGLIKNEINELNKKLPFKILNFKVNGKLRRFLLGDELQIHLELEKDKTRLIADGLAKLDLKDRNLSEVGLRFTGRTEILNAPLISNRMIRTESTIELTLKDQLSALTSLNIKTTPTDLETKQGTTKIKITHAPIELSKIGDDFKLTSRAGSVEIQASEDQVIQISKPEMELTTNLKLIDARFRARSSEILWGKWYLDLDLKPYALQASTDLEKQNQIDIKVLEGRRQPLSLNIRDFKDPTIAWELKNLSLPFAWNQFKLHSSQLLQGSLNSKGSASLNFDKKSIETLQAHQKIEGLRYKWAEKNLAIKDLNSEFDIEVRSNKVSITRAAIEISKIFFGGFHGKLSPYLFQINSDGFQGIPESTPIPLTLDEIPIQMGSMAGKWTSIDNFELNLSLKMPPTPIKNFYAFKCIQSNRPMPAKIEMNFPKIELTKNAIDLDGKIETSLWGGTITLDEMGVYDLLTDVPEMDFDLFWSGIRLDEAGKFFDLGEIDGTLEGHADDVVVQGWLPTQFKFRSEMKPQHHKMVVLSPKAMKNIVRLIAADGVDQIPGIAQWLAFGWPSRLLGGYDVNYAGIQATSQDGWIELQTLDPEKIFQIERKHFILYGPRFKMPLNTVHYPLLVDAAAMSNFMRRVINELREMAKAKHPEEGPPNEEILECFKPDF